ncbi:MAG: DUF3987 domain-containing protein [Leptolyngbyaceae cyanobacterium RM2_2_4]|nr:DUF3987 domain-containing protein [Leptolyngbyaceae cyanobacterium RM2_2_4]
MAVLGVFSLILFNTSCTTHNNIMIQFFEEYEKYVEATEPPLNFHVWTGIGTISALLGRKCYVPQGFFTVHPNLYIILVGPAGVKKSSSMNIGKAILRSIPNFPLAPSSTTREALLKSLQENKVQYKFEGRDLFYHQSAAFVTELQEFIGGKHINQSMVGIMVALWDEPDFKYETANKAPVIIPAPYFTLLGCCTKDWIVSKLKDDIITDGFSRRVVLVMEDKRAGYQPWPTSTQRKEEALEWLQKEARRIHGLKGKFRVTDEFLDYWKSELYPRINAEADSKDRYVQNYYSTKHILIIKVCMCIAAAINNDMIIDSEILKLVEQMFYITEENLLTVFEGLGSNTLSPIRAQIQDLIQTSPQVVTRQQIEQEFARDLDIAGIDECLLSLCSQGIIELAPTGYMAKVKRIKGNRKNLFDYLQQYVRPDETCSDSNKSELKRMIDAETYYRIYSNEDREQLLKKGILASGKELQRVKLLD